MGPLQKEYDYFLVLCETLSISKGAEVLGMQQGGLSKALKKLEVGLDAKLFYRNGRGLLLTDFGKTIQREVLKISENWGEGIQKSKEDLSEVAGHFKVGTHSTIAVDYLSHQIPQIIEKYRSLNLDLIFKTSGEITREIINFELDIAFVVNPIHHPDLIIRKIRKEYVSCWSKYPKKHEKILYYNPDMIDIRKIVKNFKDYKHVAIKDYEVLASFGAQSKGVCVLPSPVAERYPQLKALGPRLIHIDLCMVTHSERPKTLAFRTLLEELKER